MSFKFLKQPYISSLLLILLAVLANVVILFSEISPLRIVAGVLLIFVLPGWAWLPGVNWLAAEDWLERGVLTAGLSSALFAAAMLGAVYAPGPITLELTLWAVDGLILAGLIFSWVRTRRTAVDPPSWHVDPALIGLAVILIVGAYFRFATLGYGEFHEDELENMRLAVRAVAGQEFAPFLDSKGPIHWFFPLAMWLFNGWLSETIARLSVAITSWLTIIAVYLLGRRMANSGVALVAAALVAVNGFFIAYARHVENPSLIVFWGVLTARAAYEFYRTYNGWQLILAALLLAVGLIAHPDVLLYLPAFGLMLIGAYWRHRSQWRDTWTFALAAAGLFVALSAAFFVPYLTDPALQQTREYFATERIGTSLLYNGLHSMLDQDNNYSTRYYGPILILFSLLTLFLELRKLKTWGTAVAVALGAAMVSTVAWPQIWEWGNINGAFIPYAVLFTILTLSPYTSFVIKSLVWWFAFPFLGLEFLAKDAADHIQVVYPYWALLAAHGFSWYWHKLAELKWGRPAQTATVVALLIVAGLMFFYQHLEFIGTVSNYRLQETDSRFNPKSIYQTLYGGLPRPRNLFSNPRLGGWKVIGTLYEQDVLSGDFRSQNESFAVPIWYTYQTPRSCYTDPQNYFISLKDRERPEALDTLPQQGYSLTGIVRIDHQTEMIYIYEKGVASAENPPIYDVDDYRATFDRAAVPQRFSREYAGDHPVNLNFGNKLELLGYDLNPNSVKPGETVAIDLYWQSLAPMAIRYRAFIHIETDQMWGQHDDDPACRLRTDEWRPQVAGEGQFRVNLNPETPPGTYPITVGVYDPDTWERLEITDQNGASLGSVLELGTITVE